MTKKWIEGVPIPVEEDTYSSGKIELVKSVNYDELDNYIPSFEHEEVVPETVGQYIGIPDKNGKKVFDGDIIRFREWSEGSMCWTGKVHYEKCQFVVSGNPNKECNTPFTLCMSRFASEDIEVIGNIFDTPEMLEVKI